MSLDDSDVFFAVAALEAFDLFVFEVVSNQVFELERFAVQRLSGIFLSEVRIVCWIKLGLQISFCTASLISNGRFELKENEYLLFLHNMQLSSWINSTAKRSEISPCFVLR